MPEHRAVLLGGRTDAEQRDLADLVGRARDVAGDVPASLDLAGVVGGALPVPGAGRTGHLWSAPASVAAADLAVARTLEPGVTAVTGTWVARGLAAVDSGPVDFVGVAATAVADPGWYLERPGFAWGGIGVGAVWFRGTVGIARRLLAAAASRAPDQVALMHHGAVDAQLHAARSVLRRGRRSAVRCGRVAGRAGRGRHRHRRVPVVSRTGLRHDRPGTPPAVWAHELDARALPALALPAPCTRLVVVGAHPEAFLATCAPVLVEHQEPDFLLHVLGRPS